MIGATGRTTSRRLRRTASVVAGVVMLGALAACTDNTPAESSEGAGTMPRTAEAGQPMSEDVIEQLDVGVPGQVTTFDPTKGLGTGGLYLNTLGLESLLRLNSEGELEPWLATEWEQVSDTVYEYTLREGVKFWDGTEMTAEDVKYSWDELRSDDSRAASYFAPVENVEATDTHTVEVTLEQPDGSWQYTPALFRSVIFQKEFAEENREELGQPGRLIMGTGPWQFESLNPTTGVEMTAHEDYWGGAPPIARISAKSFEDDNSMGLALRAGEIDIAPWVSRPDGFDATAGGGTITSVSTCGTALLAMPTQTAPWDDVHVRRAVAHAINREDIIAATRGSAGDPLETLIAPSLLRSLASDEDVENALDSLPSREYDLDKAKEEMAKSTVPDGFSFEFPVDSTNGEVGQVIVNQLQEIGIDLQIKAFTQTEWSASVTGPPEDRPLTFSETGACSPDPSWDDIFLGGENLARGGLNIANYAPEEVDDLLAEGRAAQDPAERLEVYTALLDRLATDVPYVPIYEEGATYASTTYDIADYGSYWMNSPWALNLVPR